VILSAKPSALAVILNSWLTIGLNLSVNDCTHAILYYVSRVYLFSVVYYKCQLFNNFEKDNSKELNFCFKN
jgi:hypothetical protein